MKGQSVEVSHFAPQISGGTQKSAGREWREQPRATLRQASTLLNAYNRKYLRKDDGGVIVVKPVRPFQQTVCFVVSRCVVQCLTTDMMGKRVKDGLHALHASQDKQQGKLKTAATWPPRESLVVPTF